MLYYIIQFKNIIIRSIYSIDKEKVWKKKIQALGKEKELENRGHFTSKIIIIIITILRIISLINREWIGEGESE